MYRVNQRLSLQEVQEQSQTVDVRSQRSRFLGRHELFEEANLKSF